MENHKPVVTAVVSMFFCLNYLSSSVQFKCPVELITEVFLHCSTTRNNCRPLGEGLKASKIDIAQLTVGKKGERKKKRVTALRRNKIFFPSTSVGFASIRFGFEQIK